MIKRVFTFLKTNWQGKRVLHTKGKFIPQIKEDGFFSDTWIGVAAPSYSREHNTGSWYGMDSQLDYCAVDTIEEALENYELYLESIAPKETIYTMPDATPKFWRILKKNNKGVV